MWNPADFCERLSWIVCCFAWLRTRIFDLGPGYSVKKFYIKFSPLLTAYNEQHWWFWKIITKISPSITQTSWRPPGSGQLNTWPGWKSTMLTVCVLHGVCVSGTGGWLVGLNSVRLVLPPLCVYLVVFSHLRTMSSVQANIFKALLIYSHSFRDFVIETVKVVSCLLQGTPYSKLLGKGCFSKFG